jgi:hypothetical protein
MLSFAVLSLSLSLFKATGKIKYKCLEIVLFPGILCLFSACFIHALSQQTPGGLSGQGKSGFGAK